MRAGAAAGSLYLELAPSDPRAAAFCAAVEEHDRRFLAELKLVLRRGMRVFEKLVARAADEGGEQLLEVLLAVPDVVSRYCAAVAGRA